MTGKIWVIKEIKQGSTVQIMWFRHYSYSTVQLLAHLCALSIGLSFTTATQKGGRILILLFIEQ